MNGFVTEHNVSGFEHIADLDSAIWAAFEISAQPSFIFINDDGDIRRRIGGLNEERFTEELELMLSS